MALTDAVCTKIQPLPCSAFILPSPGSFFPPLLVFCQAGFKMERLPFLIKTMRLKWKCSQRGVSMGVEVSYHNLLLSVHLVSSIYLAALSHVSLTELLISGQVCKQCEAIFVTGTYILSDVPLLLKVAQP